MKNLQEGYKNDPSLFSDYETYKKAYNYDTANQEKKDVVDAFWQSKQPKDANSIYAALRSGQTIQNKQTIGTPEYNKAKVRYDNFAKYNSMGNQQLLTELKNGNIPSEIQTELAANPEFTIAKANLDKSNSTKSINEAAQ
jgi:hypothetical protein